MYDRLRFLAAGDGAMVVEIGNSITPEINRRVRTILIGIEQMQLSGIYDVIPSYRSLLVYFDPLVVNILDLKDALQSIDVLGYGDTIPNPRIIHFPTVYGGEFGPDLDYVAKHNGLTGEDVIKLHCNINYLVYMLGFAPGFPYLGGMSNKIATPRLETPRTVIPAGSVGIADLQTGIYPSATPGGWRLIGRTPLNLFDESRQPPVLVEPGDYIKFIAINQAEYESIKLGIENDTFEVVSEEAV